jgi:hypothetical protein
METGDLGGIDMTERNKSASLVVRLREKAAKGGVIPIHDMTIVEAADEIERMTRERDEYKVWWERDSNGLGKTLNDLSLERACKQDFRAQARRLRAMLEQIEQERLTWAMACECYCAPCKKLDCLIRGAAEDAT